MTELILNFYQIWNAIVTAEEIINYVRPRKHIAFVLQKQLVNTRFNYITAVTSKLTDFWNKTPCILI
jgi:hypothetical protein